jgi:hypothetical protein
MALFLLAIASLRMVRGDFRTASAIVEGAMDPGQGEMDGEFFYRIVRVFGAVFVRLGCDYRVQLYCAATNKDSKIWDC